MQQSNDGTKPMDDSNWREKILNDAKSCVLKERNATYGPPEDNFGRIAELWNAYLRIRPNGANAPLGALDVAHMMSLMKLARLAYNPTHVDSFIDFAGYVACAGGIALAPRSKLPSQQELFDKHIGTNNHIVGPVNVLPNDTAHRGLFFIDESRTAALTAFAAWTSRSKHPMADLNYCLVQKSHPISAEGLLGFIEVSASAYHPNRTFTASARWFRDTIASAGIIIDRIDAACLAHNVTIFIVS